MSRSRLRGATTIEALEERLPLVRRDDVSSGLFGNEAAVGIDGGAVAADGPASGEVAGGISLRCETDHIAGACRFAPAVTVRLRKLLLTTEIGGGCGCGA